MRLDRDSWRGLTIVALLLAAFALKGALIAPHGGSGEFDTERALARLQRIQGDQRPIRSTRRPMTTPATG
jgi:hypothetical protein